jgi:hypothetical protein
VVLAEGYMDNAQMTTLTLAHKFAASFPVDPTALCAGDFVLHGNATDWNKEVRHG